MRKPLGNNCNMELSLIFPVFNESDRLLLSLQDLNSFLQRWSFPHEIIFVVDPGSDDSAEILRNYNFTNPHVKIQVLSNAKRIGRGRSLERGLRQASGKYIFAGSIDLNVPLAEYLNALLDFQTDEKIELIVGNRFDLKKPRHGERNSWAKSLEEATREKWHRDGNNINDPTCPFLALRHSGKEKLLPNLKLGRWFYTPQILRLALQQQMLIHQKAVLCHDSLPSRFGLRDLLSSFFL